MTDSKISQLPTYNPSDVTNLFLPGIDLTQSSMNVKISAHGMLSAFLAANQSGGSQNSQHQLGVTVAAGNFVDSIMYNPIVPTNDVCILSLEISQATIAVVPYYFQIYAGNPATTGVKLYDSITSTGQNSITSYTTFLASTLYIPYAAGNTTIYIRVYNVGFSMMTFSFQTVGLEFVGNGVVLPQYQDPPPYLGALQSTVHVGPNEQFIEPRYGLQALADGGTMYVDNGHYYLPIGFLSTASSNLTIKNYGGTTANPSNRFTGGITIQGASTYGVVFDGRGGYGTTGLYRLTQGKAFVYTNVPITVSNVNFISCGGADGAGDGEAGFYPENFSSPGTATIQSCGFDNNENGILVPSSATTTGNTITGVGPGVNVTIDIVNTDFGFNAPNGVTPDGLSHNFYLEGPASVVTGCNMYGAAVGNTMKNRGPSLTVSNTYIEAGGGRCIDFPAAGTLTVSNSTLTSNSAANASFLGYANEFNYNGVHNPQFNNCTITGTRGGAVIWMGDSAAAFQFNNCTQNWYRYSPTPAFEFTRINSQANSDPTCVTGISNAPVGDPNPTNNYTFGGTVLTTPPPRPASVAQSGAVPTGFNAWNGFVG